MTGSCTGAAQSDVRTEKDEKKPRRSGVFVDAAKLLVTGADDFNFNATVLCATGGCFVAGDWLLFAFAFGVDAAGFDAFRYQIRLDGFSAANRQLLVVSIRTYRVGVADSDDDFEVHAFELRVQIVKLCFAFWLQH